MRHLILTLLFVSACIASPRCARADEPLLGRAVADVIDEFRDNGIGFAYSTLLVTDDMRVQQEPAATEPVEIVREILQPFGLTLTESSGYFLVVKSVPAAAVEVPQAATVEEGIIENVTVSASRYEFADDFTSSSRHMDQAFLRKLPDLGDDPVRAAQRLPGSASSDISAKTHFRGGEQVESGLVLNGYELLDPFHMRDFQSIFSVIDSRIIDGVEIYTGGFPVNRGNLMSGIVSLDTIDGLGDRRGEIGLSLLNTSVLLGGSFAGERANWLLSARRGNLDLVIPREDGSPSYHDIFAQLTVDFSARASLSANLLYADDDISVILADEVDDIERAHSDTNNLQLWLRLDNRWSEELSSRTLLAATDFSNERAGIIDDPERLTGTVSDVRSFTKIDFRQEWTWAWTDLQLLQWGFDLSYGSADYDYQSESRLSGLSSMIEGVSSRPAYDLRTSPSGNEAGLYVSDRLKIGERTYVELGLRWDSQNYDDNGTDNQLSPRASLFYETQGNTEFRLSWGRYYQPQGLHQLQIEDGVTEFSAAQRSDHLIAGVRVPVSDANTFRAEVFLKQSRSLRRRFENLLDPLNLLPEIEPDRIAIAPSQATATGIEIMLDGSPSDGLAWWASYTWSRVKDRVNGVDEYRNWDQTHALQAGLNLSTERWDFGLATHLRSGWPTTDMVLLPDDGSGEIRAAYGPRNAQRFPAYFTVDARLARRFAIGDTLLTAYLEVSNLMNRDNTCCVDYDLEFDDNDNPYLDRQTDSWLPIIPVLGVLWEF